MVRFIRADDMALGTGAFVRIAPFTTTHNWWKLFMVDASATKSVACLTIVTRSTSCQQIFEVCSTSWAPRLQDQVPEQISVLAMTCVCFFFSLRTCPVFYCPSECGPDRRGVVNSSNRARDFYLHGRSSQKSRKSFRESMNLNELWIYGSAPSEGGRTNKKQKTYGINDLVELITCLIVSRCKPGLGGPAEILTWLTLTRVELCCQKSLKFPPLRTGVE